MKFQFDPEIERTARRIRKEHRGLRSIANIVDLEKIKDLNSQGRIDLVNAQRV